MTAAKKQQTKAEPQPAASTAQAPQAPKPMASAPAAQPQPASKQQTTIGLLIEGWTKKGIDLSHIEVKDDGKYKLIVPGAGWPTIRIGSSGGIELPEIKSYPRAFDAALNGKELLEKQTARAAKKTAAPPPPPVAGTAKPQSTSASKPETPAAKKQKANAAIEAQLEARA
jgi:hypothetical protein